MENGPFNGQRVKNKPPKNSTVSLQGGPHSERKPWNTFRLSPPVAQTRGPWRCGPAPEARGGHRTLPQPSPPPPHPLQAQENERLGLGGGGGVPCLSAHLPQVSPPPPTHQQVTSALTVRKWARAGRRSPWRRDPARTPTPAHCAPRGGVMRWR